MTGVGGPPGEAGGVGSCRVPPSRGGVGRLFSRTRNRLVSAVVTVFTALSDELDDDPWEWE